MRKRKIGLVLISLIFAGCGISTDNGKAFEVNPDILDPGVQKPTSTSIEGQSVDDIIVDIYLVSDGELVAIDRQFNEKPSVQEVLDALSRSPLASEIEEVGFFVETLLPPSMDPQHTQTENQIVEITVADGDLREISSSDPGRTSLIFAQIVCTLDQFEINPEDEPSEKINGVVIEDSLGPIEARDIEFLDTIEGAASPKDFKNCAQKLPESVQVPS